MTKNDKQKIEILKTLRDYKTSSKKMLAVVKGEKTSAEPFDKNIIFVRSLQRLSWHKIIFLWGAEQAT